MCAIGPTRTLHRSLVARLYLVARITTRCCMSFSESAEPFDKVTFLDWYLADKI